MENYNNKYYLHYKDQLVIAMGIFYCPIFFTQEQYLRALDIMINYKGEEVINPSNN